MVFSLRYHTTVLREDRFGSSLFFVVGRQVIVILLPSSKSTNFLLDELLRCLLGLWLILVAKC